MWMAQKGSTAWAKKLSHGRHRDTLQKVGMYCYFWVWGGMRENEIVQIGGWINVYTYYVKDLSWYAVKKPGD